MPYAFNPFTGNLDYYSSGGGGVSLSTPNTWTATNTFAPSSTSSKGLIVKRKAGSTVNSFEVENSSGTAMFYVDNSDVINFASDSKFRNIAGGSLLGLNNSNILQGINTLTNISYDPTSSTIKAFPSGSDTQYQYNSGGTLAADSHAVRNSNTSSTFTGTADVPPAAGGYSGATEYGPTAGSFTTGYAVDGSTKGYRLITEKTSALDGSKYYSSSFDVSALADNNSTITLAAASGGFSSGAVTGSGPYINQTVYYSLIPFATYNGNKVFAPSPTYANGGDFSSTSFYVQGIQCSSYTWPLGYSAHGFRILRSLDNGVTYDSYQDVGDISTTPFDDVGSGWVDVFVSGVTASENPGAGNYLESGTVRDYRIYANWTTINGGPNYWSYLGTATPAQNGFTDGADGVTLYAGNVGWSAFSLPADADSSTLSYIIFRQVNGGGFTQYYAAGNVTSLNDYDDSLWTFGSIGTQWPGNTITSVKNFFRNNFAWTTVAGASGFKMLYSPNNFTSLTTGAAVYVSNPAANFGSSGYNNQTIDYQVWAWQIISGVKIYAASNLYLSVADSSGNPFGVDIAFSAPSSPAFSAYATSTGYTLQRNVNGAGFLDYQDFSSTSFTDSASGWTTGTPTLTPQNGTYYVAKDLGLVTSFTDDGAISWADSITVTPNSAGPFGATIGGSSAGLSTNGPLNVNSSYSFPSGPASGAGQIQKSASASTMVWADLNFTSLAGSLAYSQLGFSGGLTGSIAVSSGSAIGAGVSTFDYGLVYQTLRAPTVLAFSSGLQNGPNASGAYWQLYSPTADLSWYNVNGSYGEWLHVSNTDRKVSFPVGKINSPLPTSSAGLSTGDWWCDTTGGLNIIKIK